MKCSKNDGDKSEDTGTASTGSQWPNVGQFEHNNQLKNQETMQPYKYK